MADGKVWATEASRRGRRLARTVACPTCTIPADMECATRGGYPTVLVHRARWDAVQHLILPSVLLRRVLREAFAEAGDAVFERRQRGESVDLYDVVADAIIDEFELTPKERS